MCPTDTALNVHHIAQCSQANGPGIRFTIWVQGCSIGCPGCFNPETHASDVCQTITVANLLEQIHDQLAAGNITGITLSGGEPFDQPQALFELLLEVKKINSLTVLVYSGYTLPQIQEMAYGPRLLKVIDTLIAGPYCHTLQTEEPGGTVLGSSNQIIHCLSNRLGIESFNTTPLWELVIHANGEIEISGPRKITL